MSKNTVANLDNLTNHTHIHTQDLKNEASGEEDIEPLSWLVYQHERHQTAANWFRVQVISITF